MSLIEDTKNFLTSTYWIGDNSLLTKHTVYLYLTFLLTVLNISSFITIHLIEINNSQPAIYTYTYPNGIPIQPTDTEAEVPPKKLFDFIREVTLESFNLGPTNWRKTLFSSQIKYFYLLWGSVAESNSELTLKDVNSTLNIKPGTGSELIATFYQSGLLGYITGNKATISTTIISQKILKQNVYQETREYLTEQIVQFEINSSDFSKPKFAKAKIIYLVFSTGTSSSPSHNMLVERIQIDRYTEGSSQ